MTLWSYTNVTGTSYELSQQTNTGTNSASVYNFKNGFTITNSNSKNYATGGSTGIKFSAGVQYTITLPTGFNVCEVVFNGYDNYDDADAYIGEVNGEAFDATTYVFPKSKSTVSRTVRLSKVATGSMTFTVQGKQCVLSITLKGANGELFTSYWKEVGGKSYDASSATILQYTKDTNNPDRVSFELDDLSEISFTNAGNQQCVIISIDYHKLPEVIPCDVNGDAKIDGTDVSMVVNHILGLPTTGFIKKAADLNDDGRVDITDLTRLIDAIP